jgi:hypothetical protein
MALSENVKLRLDFPLGETQQDGPSQTSDPKAAGPGDEAESQMRKALGLLGDMQRHRVEPERAEPSARIGDRFNGGLHRRRFVQDGDVPVTVLRRDQGHEAPVHRGVAAPPAPTSSRLQRTEAALAAETAARDKAERLLVETQSVVRDLQTKIGHAELAKNEAIEALHREREAIAELRADNEGWEERLQEARDRVIAAERNANLYHEQLTDERQARKNAEKAQRAAEAARDAAEQLVRTLSEEPPRPRQTVESSNRARVVVEPEVVSVSTRRGRQSEPAAVEPEPVKWWLNTKPAGKKR